MTDWAVQSVFFCLNTTQKLPEIERNCPKTALKLLPNPPKKLVVSEERETAVVFIIFVICLFLIFFASSYIL